VEPAILTRILEAAELGPQETVVEVGPGLGLLTRELAPRCRRVLAVELDAALAAALPEMVGLPANLTVLQADILSLSPDELSSEPYKVVANLPFYIASQVIRLFLEASHKPQRMVVMVQKEVAQRMLAKPGEMSILGVAIQLYSRPRLVTYVPARCFYPPPKVESAVVCLEVYDRPALELADVNAFFRVVRAGFSAPRKQLRNTLSQGLGLRPEIVAAVLESVGVSPQRRPQTLALEEWGAVCGAVVPHLSEVADVDATSASQD